MAIIGTLPNTISNGQAVDATPVMADFNFIVNQVNANANPLGTLTAPTGTSMNFFNATAPLGWTINAGVNDHTVWLNSAAGGTTGGAGTYSSMFQAQWTSDGHALTTAELAAHNHTLNDPGHNHTMNQSAHSHGNSLGGGQFLIGSAPGATVGGFQSSGPGTGFFFNIGGASTTDSQLIGISNNASITGISVNNNGSGSAHTHTKTFNAQYVAAVVAVKS